MAKTKKKSSKRKVLKNTSTFNKDHTDNFSEVIIPELRPDPEEDDSGAELLGPDEDDIDPIDAEFSKYANEIKDPVKKYPSPKKNPIFRAKWKEFVKVISNLPGFKTVYLHQLEVLCDLYVEHAELSKIIRQRGYSYQVNGRQGKIIKVFPEVAQRNRVNSEILKYSKILGLVLAKDKGQGGDPNQGDDFE